MELKATAISRPMSVVIVDPDASEREALLRVLVTGASPREMALEAVGSVAEALRLFRRGHPDLLLISTANIEAVGKEIVRHIRASEGNRHTGIIFVDSRPLGDSALSVECLELGADDYLRRGCTHAELMARVRAVLRLKAMTDELRSANHKLRLLSMTDELTGLANMRCFNQRYSELVRVCRGGDTAIGVLMLDLDHFKSVNDTTNHLVGSFVIAEVGRLLKDSSQFTPRDIAARFGGDEFIIACEADNLKMLSEKAELVRRVIESACFQRDNHDVQITASLGTAWVARGFRGRAEDIIKAADLMLYRSKNLGRNCVSGMVLKYPVDLGHEQAKRLARRGSEELAKEEPAEMSLTARAALGKSG